MHNFDFSCRPVRYFGTLFWDDITKFWDENLLLFTFLFGKLRKNLFWTIKKFVYLLKTLLFSNDQKRIRGAQKMNLFTILVEL